MLKILDVRIWKLQNPFFVFILTFGLAILLYHLKWSKFYPELHQEFYTFFLVIFSLSFIMALITAPTIEKIRRIGFFFEFLAPLIFFVAVVYRGPIIIVLTS